MLILLASALATIIGLTCGIRYGRHVERRKIDGIVREGRYVLAMLDDAYAAPREQDHNTIEAFRIAVRGYDEYGEAI